MASSSDIFDVLDENALLASSVDALVAAIDGTLNSTPREAERSGDDIPEFDFFSNQPSCRAISASTALTIGSH